MLLRHVQPFVHAIPSTVVRAVVQGRSQNHHQSGALGKGQFSLMDTGVQSQKVTARLTLLAGGGITPINSNTQSS